MSAVLVRDRFIRCEIMVHGIEIHQAIFILQVYYWGRVWVVYCYRSIPSLTVGCVHAERVKSLQLETCMIKCLTCYPLQEYIIRGL
jgi:hypothetical protein